MHERTVTATTVELPGAGEQKQWLGLREGVQAESEPVVRPQSQLGKAGLC